MIAFIIYLMNTGQNETKHKVHNLISSLPRTQRQHMYSSHDLAATTAPSTRPRLNVTQGWSWTWIPTPGHVLHVWIRDGQYVIICNKTWRENLMSDGWRLMKWIWKEDSPVTQVGAMFWVELSAVKLQLKSMMLRQSVGPVSPLNLFDWTHYFVYRHRYCYCDKCQ